MSPQTKAFLRITGWLPLFFATTPSVTIASNQALQDIFFAACGNASGALAARCNETDDGLGNLSGDSETSLNPSQVLSGHQQSTREKLSRSAADETSQDSPATTIEMGKWGITLNAGRSWETFDREQDIDNERGYDADGKWALLGADYRWSDTTHLGVLLRWEENDLDYNATNPGRNFTPPSSSGEVNSDALGIGVYLVSWINDSWYIDTKVGFSQGDRTYRRNAVFQESNRAVPQTDSVTEGETDLSELWASALVGTDWHSGAWSWGISAELSYIRTEIDAFNERDLSGSGLAMSFSDADQSSVIGRLNASAQRAIATDFGVAVPYGRLGWVHDFRGDGVEINARYLLDQGNNVLDLRADDPDDGYGVANIGLSLVFTHGWMAYIEGEYWAGYDDLDRHSIALGFRKEL